MSLIYGLLDLLAQCCLVVAAALLVTCMVVAVFFALTLVYAPEPD